MKYLFIIYLAVVGTMLSAQNEMTIAGSPETNLSLSGEIRNEILEQGRNIFNIYAKNIKVNSRYDSDEFINIFADDCILHNDLEIIPSRPSFDHHDYEGLLQSFDRTGTGIVITNPRFVELSEDGTYTYVLKVEFTKSIPNQLDKKGKVTSLKKAINTKLSMSIYIDKDNLNDAKIQFIDKIVGAKSEKELVGGGRDFRQSQFAASIFYGLGAMSSSIYANAADKSRLGNTLNSTYNTQGVGIHYRRELDNRHRWLWTANTSLAFGQFNSDLSGYKHNTDDRVSLVDVNINTAITNINSPSFNNITTDNVLSEANIEKFKNGKELLYSYNIGFHTGIARRLINKDYQFFQLELAVGVNYLIQRKQGEINGEISGSNLPVLSAGYFPNRDELPTGFLNKSPYSLSDEAFTLTNIEPTSNLSFGLKLSPTYQYLNGPIGYEIGLDLCSSLSPVLSQKDLTDESPELLIGDASLRQRSVLEDYFKPGLLFSAALRVGILFRIRKKN